MKDIFEPILKEILKDLKARRPSTPFYHDEDGEINDDKYQEALEVSWDREDSGIDDQIQEIEYLLEEDVSEDYFSIASGIVMKHGYKVIITKNF